MIEPSTCVAVAVTALLLDQSLGAQVGEQCDDIALDGALRIGKAVLEPRADRVLVAAGLDFAHDGRCRGVQRVDLFASGLEKDAAEFLLAELHVLGKAHRPSCAGSFQAAGPFMHSTMVRKSSPTCHRFGGNPRPASIDGSRIEGLTGLGCPATRDPRAEAAGWLCPARRPA